MPPAEAVGCGVFVQPDDLTIRLSARAGDLCLTVSGEVDIATAHLLRKVAVAVLRTRAASRLALDMSGVGFIDAVGVAAVIDCRREAARRNLPFSVINPSAQVTATMRLCGAADLLTDAVDGVLGWPLRSMCALRRPSRSWHSSTRHRCYRRPLPGDTAGTAGRPQ
ncbi:hypothetical protein CS0771_46860 [Catellatospora sp. IY07-71]|uniref:STAS domain-containing protein n=1 Tax=Catellatospora sp. IY07-71 TaxID=2728827 RepID=UPI001BB3373F|nr:STAS domain-containing protein [Catellatospora sp. IY07-71]BCJ75142.1 hypothetical protein CS0771_46860 [Catellatospora sp. IY07-71]